MYYGLVVNYVTFVCINYDRFVLWNFNFFMDIIDF